MFLHKKFKIIFNKKDNAAFVTDHGIVKSF